MIGRLEGDVVANQDDILTVQAGSLGLEVRTTAALAAAHPVGSQIRLWTHLAMREQGMDLYGFSGREERDLFRLVQRVPQVGAKTALAMLAVFAVPTLMRVIRDGDVQALTTVPGIGRKGAERIVVELRDRFEQLGAGLSESVGPAQGYDAVQALVGLGYTASEAQRAVGRAIEAGVAADDVEALLRRVLTQGDA